jgi:hypothetical protein
MDFLCEYEGPKEISLLRELVLWRRAYLMLSGFH